MTKQKRPDKKEQKKNKKRTKKEQKKNKKRTKKEQKRQTKRLTLFFYHVEAHIPHRLPADVCLLNLITMWAQDSNCGCPVHPHRLSAFCLPQSNRNRNGFRRNPHPAVAVGVSRMDARHCPRHPACRWAEAHAVRREHGAHPQPHAALHYGRTRPVGYPRLLVPPVPPGIG